jgi:membrane-associated protease RseP (regulator of RpoE activity)
MSKNLNSLVEKGHGGFMNRRLLIGLSLLTVVLIAGIALTKPENAPELLNEKIQSMISPESGFRVGIVLSESKGEAGGVAVEKVLANSPAEKAGIRSGDIIQKIDGKEIESARDVRNFFRQLDQAKEVEFQLLRDGKPMTVRLTPEKRNRMFLRNSRKQLGIQLQELDPDLAGYFQVDPNAGVLIARVEPNGAAAKAGLRSGDVITHVNGRKVNGAEDIHDAINDLKDDESLEITVLRRGDQKKFNVKPEVRKAAEFAPFLHDFPEFMDRPEFRQNMDQLQQEMDKLKQDLDSRKGDIEKLRKELQEQMQKEFEKLRKDLQDKNKET